MVFDGFMMEIPQHLAQETSLHQCTWLEMPHGLFPILKIFLQLQSRNIWALVSKEIPCSLSPSEWAICGCGFFPFSHLQKLTVVVGFQSPPTPYGMEKATFFFWLKQYLLREMQCHLSNISNHCGRLITVTSSHQRNSFTPARTYSVAFGITSREEPILSHHLMHFPSLGLISIDMIIWIMHDENIKFGLPKMGTFWKYLSALFSDLPSSRYHLS